MTEDARHSSRFPAGRWSDVTVHLTDDTVLVSGDIHAKGGPEVPMSLHEVEAKFHTMAANLAPERRAAIWAMRERLQAKDAKFSELLALIHQPMGA